MNNVVQGLWIGRLTQMEIACMQSYLNQGHEFHLYAYQDFTNLPAGVKRLDANEIIPNERLASINQGEIKGSYAGFADLFRYKLLFERGGWWTDMDILCFNPLPNPSDFFAASEWNPKHIRRGSKRRILVFLNQLLKRLQTQITILNLQGWYLNNLMPIFFTNSPTCSLMYSPPRHVIMRQAMKISEETQLAGLKYWGEIGPALISRLLKEQPNKTTYDVGRAGHFMPISYSQIFLLFEDFKNFNHQNITTIHLYNEVWRQNGFSKESTIPPSSLLQSLILATNTQRH